MSLFRLTFMEDYMQCMADGRVVQAGYFPAQALLF